jgi:glycosyltransferase involved in cell wall biosynthesis
MRIGIDASAMVVARQTGVEHYLSSLIKALTAAVPAAGIELFLYVFSGNSYADPARMDVVRQLSNNVFVRVWPFSRGYDLALPLLARMDRLQLLHIPTSRMPRFSPCPVVITVHDLCWLTLPEEWVKGEKRLAMTTTTRAIQKAHGIIVVSESTRADVITRFGARPDRIQVTLEGIDRHPIPSDEEVERVRQKYQLGPYILYLGTLQTRKNLIGLIGAFERLRAKYGIAHKLVIAGGKGHGWQEVHTAAACSCCAEQIIFLGYVPESDIRGLYGGTDVFVYPSLCEGFGLPVGEAMSCGVPVVAASGSSLSEVGGDAAMYFDPSNVEDMAKKLFNVISDQSLRCEMIRKGVVRARELTWNSTASETISAYMKWVRTAP